MAMHPNDDSHRLDDLLIPSLAFADPWEVADDPDLTVAEKRAILASWASDAQAAKDVPTLRQMPTGNRFVPVDEILAALRSLDRNPSAAMAARAKRDIRRASIEAYRVRSASDPSE
jgi:hypothetical protein